MERDLPNLTIHQLLYVREVFRTPTWTEAASALGVTQSALSQGIAEVERRLGTPLFERRGRVRLPTAAGEALRFVADDVVALVDDLARRLVELDTGTSGTLRIGMIDTAALGFLAAPLAEFRRTFSKVRTSLVVEPSVALTERVAAGELDAAVVVIPNAALARGITDDRFNVQTLEDEAIFVYAPPDTLVGTAATWGPWVTYPAGSQTQRLISRALGALGVTVDIVAASSNPDVLRQMVRLGVGWCALPASVAESGPEPLTRAQIQPIVHRTIALVRRRTALSNGALDAFVGLLGLSGPGMGTASPTP